MTQKVFDFEKKLSVIQVESFELDVHFICVGLNSQRKVQKTQSVIQAQR